MGVTGGDDGAGGRPGAVARVSMVTVGVAVMVAAGAGIGRDMSGPRDSSGMVIVASEISVQ